ncbi:MAG: hypothetical protein OZ921_18330 [Sorangiineae bacterium]|nr:hypothetical protein [Polyangiaceae bacterium]MEB2324478.1 hypothetical protein [Sorangiineae bacterium]
MFSRATDSGADGTDLLAVESYLVIRNSAGGGVYLIGFSAGKTS